MPRAPRRGRGQAARFDNARMKVTARNRRRCELSGFSLGVPAGSQAEVDRLLRQVEAAGGTLTAPAHLRPFGVYSGYFADPDGHLFEIAWDSNA
jgi:predicted lactoylglutathione lyase